MNRHNINLLAFLAFAAVAILAVWGYEHHTNGRFDAADRISCANRQILIANQRIVLNVLERNVGQFIRDAPDEAQRAYFKRSLLLLEHARRTLDKTPVCLDRTRPSHKTPTP